MSKNSELPGCDPITPAQSTCMQPLRHKIKDIYELQKCQKHNHNESWLAKTKSKISEY